MAKNNDIPKTDPVEIEQLIQRLKQSNIEPRDLDLVERLLRMVLTLVRVLQQKNASLKRLKPLIFGPGSDRRAATTHRSAEASRNESADSALSSDRQSGSSASSENSPSSSSSDQKRRGHGRRSASV